MSAVYVVERDDAGDRLRKRPDVPRCRRPSLFCDSCCLLGASVYPQDYR